MPPHFLSILMIKISAVSYLNTLPFVYGIEQSGYLQNYLMELDTPALCAEKLIKGQVDIGLIPVAVLPELKYYRILSSYCIGADGPVKTVVLYSNSPLEKI